MHISENQDFDCEMELGEDELYEFEVIENGRRIELKIHVSQAFHSQLIGAKGNTRKRLEAETKTQIIIPKIDQRNSSIILRGLTKKSLITVKNRIDLICVASRKKHQFTHFLSIPFVTEEIRKNFAQFKHEVLNDSDIYGINEALFQKEEKLHLTITMLVLLDNDDRSISSEYLQDCKELVVDSVLQGPLYVKLQGLNYMNDEPSSVDVLYAKVISEELQDICDGIARYFADRGYIQLKHDNVKLHVTLMNTRFLDLDDAIDEAQDSRDHKQKTFDASKILQKYKDFYFGTMLINEIHLSQRYSKASNGYYEATAILKL